MGCFAGFILCQNEDALGEVGWNDFHELVKRQEAVMAYKVVAASIVNGNMRNKWQGGSSGDIRQVACHYCRHQTGRTVVLEMVG